MLPKRLELRNFLAYRTPDPIIFEDLHLACLSGQNGAGKSSLLDAITWALWGKARGRSDDDLIHLGQTEMQVTLDFLQDSQLYRVIRQRKAGKAKKGGGISPGQSSLTLFSWDEEQNRFTLINEPTMRETQNRINHLLRLDYEIFVHSAFLQQGKADAFTTKTPAQRKDILSEILGLDRWLRYEEVAREKLLSTRQEVATLTTRIADMEAEIAEEPAFQRELEEARELLHSASEEVRRAEARLEEVKGADVELRSVEEMLTTVEYNIREREKDLARDDEEIARYQERLSLFQAVIANAEQIKQGYEELEKARQADLELGDKLRELNDINQRIAALEAQINTARQELELEVRGLETLIQADREVVALGAEVQARLQEIDAEIAELEALEAQRETFHNRIGELNEAIAALRSKNEVLEQEMNELRQRLILLKESTAPECPTCGQPLNEQQKQDLIAQITDQGVGRREEQRANTARIKQIKDEIAEINAQVQDAGKYLKRLPALRGERGGLEQQVMAAQEAQERIHAHQIKVNELQHILTEGRFAEALQAQLEETRQQREKLGYDPDRHTAVRQQMETYLNYQDKAKELELATQQIPEIEQSLENARQRRARWQKSLEEYQEQVETHRAEIDHLQVKVAEMKLRQEELNHQRTIQRSAEEKVIAIEQNLKSIARLRERRIEMLERREQLIAQETIYDQLKNAFGRNGIPAMLIDAAIPELEEEANRLLARMTNNRMHLRFDTQREKKTGGIAETLDIWIQDELGQRDYSLFSGGEAFRVNFAIRIALSQLLARRAGAQLRTLFIDEGFGTQDEAGRERLVEAITSIQDDFDLVLVITHLEDLRDAFPARIEVSKTPNGSLAVVR